MKLLMRVCPSPSRSWFVSTAHINAAKIPSNGQDEYDLIFGDYLLKLLWSQHLVTAEEIEPNAMWATANAPATPIVATKAPPLPKVETPERVKAPAVDPNDRSNWTVEQWEAEGVKFKPAAARIESDGVSILQRPVDMPHTGLRPRSMSKARPIEQLADQLADTYPWGASAVPVAKWAWEAAGLPGKPNFTRQIEISRVLTVLYHAGVIQQNALVPVGMGQKKSVNPVSPGRPKKKK